MKLLHLADLHLGSEMNARLTQEKAALRREEICMAFDRAVEYAKRVGVSAILLSGDVFDGAVPLERDKEFFYDVIRQSPEILFFYLKGNHDGAEKTELLPNLKTFTEDSWTTYELGENVTVSGIELTERNSESYYDGLHLDAAKTNVVMLHGQIADGKGKEKIFLRALAGKGIDYLALGHVHSYQTGMIDARGVYAYAGCLEPRGFDETGAKGFVELDVSRGVSYRFVENCVRAVEVVEVNVTGLSGQAEVLRKIEAELSVDAEDMPRIVLVGEADFPTDGIANFIQTRLKDRYFALSVKDETVKALNLEKYMGQVSIEAEFIRVVQANETLSERDKKEVISIGLKALSGGKL